MRTKSINRSFEKDPKTDCFCYICRRDIKNLDAARIIHVIQGGFSLLHVNDERLYVSNDGDMGFWLVGPECSKKLGKNWTHELTDSWKKDIEP